MKTHTAIILIIVISALTFIVGYSVAPTDVSVVRHGATSSIGGNHGGGDSSGYGAADAGGYGVESAGGYGAEAGGYGM